MHCNILYTVFRCLTTLFNRAEPCLVRADGCIYTNHQTHTPTHTEKLNTFSLYSLSNCSITEEGFSSLASALRSNPSHIRGLWLSGNEAGDSGVKHLSSLLEDPNCKLEKLK